MAETPSYQQIPTNLNLQQFNPFVFPHLSTGRRGPASKLSLYKRFNYILQILYMGCQWEMLPIDKEQHGKAEIHYTNQHRPFRRWERDGSIAQIFTQSVLKLHQDHLLDTSMFHGDGTTTAAKKGGNNIGYSGHKKVKKGDKIVAFCDRNCNVIAPFVSAPSNRNDSPRLRKAVPILSSITQSIGLSLKGSILSLDGAYDCRTNRKIIFNRGMTPNINENKRNRKTTKRGRKQVFDPAIFRERFRTIERVFAWKDKFRRLLLRFERISSVHYAFKTLAYTLINLRHYCQ